MDFLKNFEFTPLNVLKAAGLAIGAFVVLGLAISFIGAAFRTVSMNSGGGTAFSGIPGVAQQLAYDGDYAGYERADLSVRNAIAPTAPASIPAPVPPMGGTTGDTAEEFEVTQYHGTIETRNKSEACAQIADLKAREYVIFENANEHDRGCSYTFKVARENVDEVLAFVESLDPKELSEQTYTIKNVVDDFTSETDILKNKLASIDATLESSLAAYDDITTLATRNQNADALAKIIDSRIQLIERMTQERLNVSQQLDRYERALADQLDRLNYTYFNLSVYELSYIDGEGLKDSWKSALREFVQSVNKIFQDLTVNLLLFVLLAIQYILYFFILLLVVKYVWRFARYLWYR